ncbi:acyltransferase [Bradyrhizobium sp.]|uniref:acyltransferase n=1 Tax=Bradyrhizobium sp. TaxID=376 RepID=UPI001D35414C|nr:acyltransferase [Bradyrhizobium sp.]MBI5321105.1 acyltransferase [Bradyrhizobium sp.]
MRGLLNLIDALLGWNVRRSGAVSIGRGAAVVWRRIRQVAGNRLSIGQDSIIQANIRFEDRGGEIRIGDRTYIGKSDLVCYRSIVIGDDVIMSWGITITDHDSHSLDWALRKNDVLDWGKGRKDWSHVATAPVVIGDKAWIGFNVSILKGVTIGEGAVVGACTVVTRDVPPDSVVVGNPARVVRKPESTG